MADQHKRRHERTPQEFAEELLSGQKRVSLVALSREIDTQAEIEHKVELSILTNRKKEKAIILLMVHELMSLKTEVEQMRREMKVCACGKT